MAWVEKPQSCFFSDSMHYLEVCKNLRQCSLTYKRKKHCVEKALTICVGVSHFLVCHYSCCCIIYLNGMRFTVSENMKRKLHANTNMQTVTHTVVDKRKNNFCVHIQVTMQDLEKSSLLSSSACKKHFLRIPNE